MRNNPSVAERDAWRALGQFRAEGFTFRRQRPIGRYIVDFVCLRRRVIVEIDGGLHERLGRRERDAERDAWLAAEGYAVLRFSDREARNESFLLRVRNALQAQPARPYLARQDAAASPLGEGEEHPHEPFWKTKTLAEMSEAEWESLCDGCGKCCLVGLEDEDSGEIYLTDVACKLFDSGKCRCSDYAHRFEKVEDCVKLTAKNVPELHWLPKTCAYRLVAQGRDLYWWHPLVSGDPESVHAANVSVRGKTSPERGQKIRTLMRRIVEWPMPKRAPAATRRKTGGR